MDLSHDPIESILRTLQERAKELNCLYQVDERLAWLESPPAEVFRGLLDVLPAGWQYPSVCRARIVWEDQAFEPEGFAETPWVQSAPIVLEGRRVGRVDVCYTQPMPKADEGPFLKEERKLIDTIADRIAHHLMQRSLRNTAQEWQAASRDIASAPQQGWWVIIDFLRHTDRHLLIRLSRKMLNHLCWNGIEEAQALLGRFAPEREADAESVPDDSRPVEKKTLQDLLGLTDETFRIAAAHLSEAEIVSRIQKWIKDDKSAFLLETLEHPGTPIAEITDALQRYKLAGMDEREMTRPVQTALHVSLVRRFFTDELDFINKAKGYVRVAEFHDLAQRIIAPANSRGKLGGKSSGLFLATQIVRNSPEYAALLSGIKVPKTWYVASDALLHFIQYNHLEDVYNRKYLELDQIRREYPHIVQVFKNSHFSPELSKGLSEALDDLEGRPLIVRSSSLLEDRMGAAFSGKYKSLFLANVGTKRERLAALQDAVAEVYASIFGPDPLEYRAERGMLDQHEEMGIMIQEVVGTRVGKYFFPAFSGVGFSNNEFRWSSRIKREDGLLRLVPGLGTRAVDRLVDDYPVLIAPGQPGLRVNVAPEEVVRYAPRMADVINLESRAFESVAVRDLVRSCGPEFPMLAELLSVAAEDSVRPAVPLQVDHDRDTLVVTFDGLVSRTPFVTRMRSLLKLLRDKLGVPVDIEFAHDGRDLYLLQCRPQSYASDAVSVPIPADLPRERLLFTANRFVSNGRVPDVTHVVYVDPERYGRLPDLADLKEVGRAVGKLNKLLPKRQFILIGPGRWGSRGDIKLGVSVTYSDINNTAVLIEVARKAGNYVPDLSFGTHFFQDLVEASIRYLPLYPDDPENVFNERFFHEAPNILPHLLPECARLADTVRVIDVPRTSDGLVLKVLMNADQDRAVGVLGAPAAAATGSEPRREPETIQDTHRRWRTRMAERIAAQMDAERFGVRGVYLFGSTKNGTAGPSSDIDLLVHFAGDAEQRRALADWLEGWSLCLSELNYLRTGFKAAGLLDVEYVTDDDVARQTSYAAKIGAVTDAARPLRVGGRQAEPTA